jgi:uncharacterized coiled-coil protein SlyX
LKETKHMNHILDLKPLKLFALALTCLALAPVAKAKQQSEDRGNGNSAAEDVSALNLGTTGPNNTTHGWFSLFSNTSGFDNTANGFQALYSNTTGMWNTASGVQALYSNTTGPANTANGWNALFHNTTGDSNTAIGYWALLDNTTGVADTATGAGALINNTTGGNNTANGLTAPSHNTTGNGNTAIGANALINNTTGSNNTAIGIAAGASVITASNVICIGTLAGTADVSNTIWINNVYSVTTQNATTAPVIVSADNQLGTLAFSERFKKDIATMEQVSRAILSLRPVTFHYKTDTKGTPQFGLITEEVAKVNPALVLPDKEGKPYTVRYEAVNAMLLNEFLKEHRTVQEQGATITQLKSMVEKQEAANAQQQKQIEALTTGFQKVSAQLEASKPAPQVVNNP